MGRENEWELEMTGTEVGLKLRLSQSAVSHAVSRGDELVMHRGLKLEKWE